MEFGTDIHVPQRINPNNLRYSLNFNVVLPGGQRFHLSHEISQHLHDDRHTILHRHSWFPDDEPCRLW